MGTIDTVTSRLKSLASSSKTKMSLAAIRQQMSSSSPFPVVDILLTNTWPASMTAFSSSSPPLSDVNECSAQPLDQIVRLAKPRYHFACGAGDPPQFWEREPFVWDDENGRVTRFVTLGAFGTKVQEGVKKPRVRTTFLHVVQMCLVFLKWFYAFSIAPVTASTPTPPRPSNATANPFVSSGTPKRTVDMSEAESFIWESISGHASNKRPRRGRVMVFRKARVRASHGGPQIKLPMGSHLKDTSARFVNRAR